MAMRFKRVMVTGGAGYVGSRLIPKLLDAGYGVNVLDMYIYGEDIFANLRDNPLLKEVKGDIRDAAAVARALDGCDAVIHLACISNDPSFDLDPALGRSINYDCFRPLVRAAKRFGVKRFIYASSSSVYGVKDVRDVTEDLSLTPLTDYSKYKALCEKVLAEEHEPGFVAVTLRPAFYRLSGQEAGGFGSPIGTFVENEPFRRLWHRIEELGLVRLRPPLPRHHQPRGDLGG